MEDGRVDNQTVAHWQQWDGWMKKQTLSTGTNGKDGCAKSQPLTPDTKWVR